MWRKPWLRGWFWYRELFSPYSWIFCFKDDLRFISLTQSCFSGVWACISSCLEFEFRLRLLWPPRSSFDRYFDRFWQGLKAFKQLVTLTRLIEHLHIEIPLLSYVGTLSPRSWINQPMFCCPVRILISSLADALESRHARLFSVLPSPSDNPERDRFHQVFREQCYLFFGLQPSTEYPPGSTGGRERMWLMEMERRNEHGIEDYDTTREVKCEEAAAHRQDWHRY